ncbi:putative invertase inhibitor [Asparagus officinalis]|uniref:putative invertase inhibitor n=1 Tax=Asparagus officinalis TaxID=4686 RepID=UPI00098E33FF|nr:putative invertase inhibitor [Asparagus officinalis]
MSPSSLLPLFLPLLLLSITNATVDDTCKAATASNYKVDYGFCTTSLRANPKSETADPKGLGLIGTQLCLTNATNTGTKINDMIKNGNFSHEVKEILRLCDGAYNNQIDLLNGAMDSFEKGDYSDAVVKVGRVKERAYDCDDLFFEGGEEDLLKKDEGDLDGLSGLALFLIGRLRGSDISKK